jgi:hypothetical protein
VKLGRVNVDAMLRSLTAAQFQEWIEYAKLEPFDETRADYRAAQIAQMILAVNMDRKKHKLPGLNELVLKFEQEQAKPKQDWRQMKETARLIAEMFK